MAGWTDRWMARAEISSCARKVCCYYGAACIRIIRHIVDECHCGFLLVESIFGLLHNTSYSLVSSASLVSLVYRFEPQVRILRAESRASACLGAGQSPFLAPSPENYGLFV